MNRREFLVVVGGSLIAVPFVLEVVSCGSESPTTPPAGFSGTGTGSGHTHTWTVTCVQVQGGVRVDITSGPGTGGHTHQVPLEIADLQTLSSGGQVTVDTTSIHPHTWTIQKPANVC